LHGDGYLSSDWNLEVSGSLSADALNALKQFIKTTFAADINGSIAHIDTQRWDYHRNIPFAYIPAFISATDLKEKMSLMDKGADKILASVETEAGYNDFFKNFPVVNREPSDEFNRTFAGSTIPFRPDKDIGQQEYFAFKSDLLRAQVTVYNKSYEPPVRGQD
jgi:hypothetical protein